MNAQELAESFVQSDLYNKKGWRPLVKVLSKSGKLQNVHTPFDLCAEIIGKLSLYTDLKKASILVGFNLEFVDVLIRDFGVDPNNITFVSDSQFKKDVALLLYKVKECLDVALVLKKIEIMPKPKRQFDVVVQNPPYHGKGKGLHIRFAELGFGMTIDGGHMLCVHPATWLICKKPNPHYQMFRDKIREDIVDLTIFNPNQVFVDTEMGFPCVVTYIHKGEKSKTITVHDKTRNKTWVYKSLDDVNIFGNYSEYFSLSTKIWKVLGERGSVEDHLGLCRNCFTVGLPKITGHLDTTRNPNGLYKDDFFTIVNGNTVVETGPVDESFFGVSFSTKGEAENFLEFCKTKFARFCLSLYKFNKNNHMGELRAVPWMDFTRKWELESIVELFSLTEEEVEFIDRAIPTYGVANGGSL